MSEGVGFPAFFAEAPRIRVHDALAEFLGSSADGTIEYGYADAVRLAGHSCPTVAGAYLMARAAVRALYPDAVPQRGDIAVRMSGAEDEGTTGVMAQVFTLITGAAGNNGFHGIAGQFTRRGLLTHDGNDPGIIARFRRLDSGAEVGVSLDLSDVPPAPAMRAQFMQALNPEASAGQRRAFADSWQERVRRLLIDHADDPAVIRVTPC